jgi:hypothetical protein
MTQSFEHTFKPPFCLRHLFEFFIRLHTQIMDVCKLKILTQRNKNTHKWQTIRSKENNCRQNIDEWIQAHKSCIFVQKKTNKIKDWKRNFTLKRIKLLQIWKSKSNSYEKQVFEFRAKVVSWKIYLYLFLCFKNILKKN